MDKPFQSLCVKLQAPLIFAHHILLLAFNAALRQVVLHSALNSVNPLQQMWSSSFNGLPSPLSRILAPLYQNWSWGLTFPKVKFPLYEWSWVGTASPDPLDLNLLVGTSPLWTWWSRGIWSPFILRLPYLRRELWPSWLYLSGVKFLGHRTGQIRNNCVCAFWNISFSLGSWGIRNPIFLADLHRGKCSK